MCAGTIGNLKTGQEFAKFARPEPQGRSRKRAAAADNRFVYRFIRVTFSFRDAEPYRCAAIEVAHCGFVFN